MLPKEMRVVFPLTVSFKYQLLFSRIRVCGVYEHERSVGGAKHMQSDVRDSLSQMCSES